jgi:hypothetical protein
MSDEQGNKIIDLLQNIFILQAQKQGFKSEDVRKILGISNNKIFKIWKRKVEKKKLKNER